MTVPSLREYLEERARLSEQGWNPGDERRLSGHLDQAIGDLAGDLPAGTAVLAIGGYGREVMALHSDVDLAFIHVKEEASDVESRVLRPLWDAKLRVGHLSHTPKGARVFAGTRIDAISTFLTSRLIAGDPSVFEEFWRLFVRLLKKEHAQIMVMLTAEETERRAKTPYRLMAADLKTGRGGIRTVDLLDWRRRLFSFQQAPAAEPDQEQHLRSELTRVRSAIHAAAGRLHDAYDLELRDGAAQYLGMSVRELGTLVLSLQAEAERLVDEQWPEVRDNRAMDPPARALAVTDVTDRSSLTSDALDRLITTVVPDWARLVKTPHLAPFHAYGVRDHSLACVDEMVRLITTPGDPLAAEALGHVRSTETLTWAALVHDIGKGLDGPHGRAGARVVAESGLSRIDPNPTLLTALTEHHLLLADLATRFDPTDPGVIGWVADKISDIETLGALYMLTMADSRATGTGTWNEWRAELVRRAYRILERELGRRQRPEDAQVELLADRVLIASDDALTMEQVRLHLTGFGDVYRSGHAPHEIVSHIRLAAEPLGVGGTTVHPSAGNPASMIVITHDRPGLLLSVAGALALNRVSITDARFATRTDGLVFDTFDVVSHDGQPLTEDTLARLSHEVSEAIRRGRDVTEALRAKQEAYRPVETPGFDPTVDIEPVGVGGGRITIETPDRIGLVFDIGLVFQAYGMPIRRARVDTRAGVAYDVFWVDRLPANRDSLISDLISSISGS